MTLIEPSWQDARLAAHAVGRRLPAEVLPLDRAHRRVTSEAVVARCDLPPFDTSAMDGWAVSGAGPWTVSGQVLAGQAPTALLDEGTAVRIATGAVLPTGTRGVLRREHGSATEDGRLDGDVADGQDVRRAGEEIRTGVEVIAALTTLGPAHLGLAAAAGHDELRVIRRPRARMLVLGDELLDRGVPREGRVRDALGTQVPSWLERLDVEVVDVVRVADAVDAHVEALAGNDDVDLLVSTGGTAAGPVDFLHRAVRDTGGQMVVDSVACRPGHPMLLAAWTDRWLVGLPGNPQAAIVALLTLGQPLIAAMHGRDLDRPGRVRVTSLITSRDRTRLVPCVLDGVDATPTSHIGSGMLRGLAAADGFAVVREGGAEADALVDWIALP